MPFIVFRSGLQEVAHHGRVTGTRGLKQERTPCDVSLVFVRTNVAQKMHAFSVPSDRIDDEGRWSGNPCCAPQGSVHIRFRVAEETRHCNMPTEWRKEEWRLNVHLILRVEICAAMAKSTDLSRVLVADGE